MKNNFGKFLYKEGKSEKTIKNYLSAFTFINQVAEKNHILKLEDWDISNAKSYSNRVMQDETFIDKNLSGNNMYSASLNNYIKYMEKVSEVPKLPFENFGWRWATTGIASHLNRPESLKIIIDALLINGNGKDNYTQEFKELINRLSNNKYNIPEEESDKLSKLSNVNIKKNIIENSANYWYHIGLLETTGQYAVVSDLGSDFLRGVISNDEFVLNRIDNYFLPNRAYRSEDISKWEENGIRIYPLKLIRDIFSVLITSYDESEHYLTENDLVRVIIPCSYDLNKFSVELIASHVISFRENPENYTLWPNPQSRYTDDKGSRMANEFLYFLEVFGFLSSNSSNVRSVADKKYFATDKFIKVTINDSGRKSISVPIIQTDFKIKEFETALEHSGLIYSDQLITRFASSLVTKPFVILTGLSGSGKTKLAQAFVQWISESEKQYCIVPVGADWINREPLLGYVNALEDKKYVLPENGALELIIRANNNASDAANPDSESELKPYFLILDEMNLSHVERYFADFLSVMESDDTFKLHSSDSSLDGGNDLKVNKEYGWPKNLFVVGTVNIDETTYMFSPKVLDRANVIEFRISSSELNKYFGPETKPLNMNLLFQKGTTIGKGAQFANSFISFEKLVAEKENLAFLNTKLGEFFVALQAVDAEFGYRTASEIQTLYSKIDSVNPTFKDSDEYKEKYSTEEDYKIDIAVMQKLLPKLHGSRSKLVEPLKVLASLCYESSLSKEEKDEIFEKASDIETKLIYPLSLEKITRMYNNVLHNGFTSYAEA